MGSLLDEHHTIRRILVATDFSPGASTALQWAARLASQHGAELILAHAVEQDVTAEPTTGRSIDDVAHDLAVQSHVASTAGLKVSMAWKVGEAHEAILAMADEHDADIIVLANRAHGTVARLFMGSTATQVVRHACQPVIAVPPEVEDSGGGCRTILVATDFSQCAMRAASWARSIATCMDSPRRLILAHAHLPAVVPAVEPGFVTPAMIEDDTAQCRAQIERCVDEMRQPGFDVESVLLDGPAAASLVDLARDRKVDLIAMGTHGRSGVSRMLLGSVAERVMHNASCPILTIRAVQKTTEAADYSTAPDPVS